MPMDRPERTRRPIVSRARRWGLAALAITAHVGCGREFFREWANQDASEAVFEKSRDPRWRIDLFSVDPPSLARYADPYDPDTPPAPPDDFATEALSPVPQWPDNRLLVPAEGTGYLDMLDAWQRDTVAKPRDAAGSGTRRRQPGVGQPRPATPSPTIPPAPPPGSASPFGRGVNSGTDRGGMSPRTDTGTFAREPDHAGIRPTPGPRGQDRSRGPARRLPGDGTPDAGPSPVARRTPHPAKPAGRS